MSGLKLRDEAVGMVKRGSSSLHITLRTCVCQIGTFFQAMCCIPKMTFRWLSFYIILTYLAALVLSQDEEDPSIPRLFTVQPGTVNGGCDEREEILDKWLEESLVSVANAVNMIDSNWNECNDENHFLGDALYTYFGIRLLDPCDEEVTENPADDMASMLNLSVGSYDTNVLFYPSGQLRYLLDWLEGNTAGRIPVEDTYLFCDSTFLVRKDNSDAAQDYEGDIIEIDDNPVPISDVPAYQEQLAAGDVPWWSGDRTDVNGYYIIGSDSGGNYCSGDNFGQTAVLQALEVVNGSPTPLQNQKTTVVLCPRAFTTSDHPETYERSIEILRGGVSLQSVVPRSATFLHEALHVLHGAGPSGYLEGEEETCKFTRILGICDQFINEDIR